MKMLRLSILLVLLSVSAFSQGQQTPEARVPHLTPIFPFDRHGNESAVFHAIVGDRHPSMWMIARPSFPSLFRPEYAVLVLAIPIMSGEPDPFGGGTRGISGYDWVIETAEIKDKNTNEVSRVRAGIPEDLAKRIRSAWNSVLDETRYSEHQKPGLDGVTVQFGTQTRAGEIWSPEWGAPGRLFELGQALILLATAPESERDRQIQACATLAEEIAEAKTKPEHESGLKGFQP